MPMKNPPHPGDLIRTEVIALPRSVPVQALGSQHSKRKPAETVRPFLSLGDVPD